MIYIITKDQENDLKYPPSVMLVPIEITFRHEVPLATQKITSTILFSNAVYPRQFKKHLHMEISI